MCSSGFVSPLVAYSGGSVVPSSTTSSSSSLAVVAGTTGVAGGGRRSGGPTSASLSDSGRRSLLQLNDFLYDVKFSDLSKYLNAVGRYECPRRDCDKNYKDASSLQRHIRWALTQSLTDQCFLSVPFCDVGRRAGYIATYTSLAKVYTRSI